MGLPRVGHHVVGHHRRRTLAGVMRDVLWVLGNLLAVVALSLALTYVIVRVFM